MAPEPRADAAPDDDLVIRVAAGDAEAFAALFRRCHAAVYRFALHMTGSAPVAEDVTQEVFLAVMRDAGRYQPGRSGVAAWLCGIARNHARRRFEADGRVVPLDRGGDEPDVDPASAASSPLDDLTRAEGIAALRRAVLTLPLPYREAVVLCDLQEMSYAMAADALGCAVGTVRSRLHRGRALLAMKLAGPRVLPAGAKDRPVNAEAARPAEKTVNAEGARPAEKIGDLA